MNKYILEINYSILNCYSFDQCYVLRRLLCSFRFRHQAVLANYLHRLSNHFLRLFCVVTNSKCNEWINSAWMISFLSKMKMSMSFEWKLPALVENVSVTWNGTDKMTCGCSRPKHTSWCFVKFVILPAAAELVNLIRHFRHHSIDVNMK